MQVNSSYSAVIQRNYFSDGLSRVGPVLAPNSVVSNNVFNGTEIGGILLSAETTWLSGNLGIDNVTVTNNTFVQCCSYVKFGFNGQCNGTFPIYNPANSTNIHIADNTVVD